jgi:hypothetical protein
MSHVSIQSPSAPSDPEYRKISSGDMSHFCSHWSQWRHNSLMYNRIIVATWLIATLWATGAVSLLLLQVIGVGDDPLVTLASAPF